MFLRILDLPEKAGYVFRSFRFTRKITGKIKMCFKSFRFSIEKRENIFLSLFLFIFISCDISPVEKISILKYKSKVSSSKDRFLSPEPLPGLLSKEYYLIKAFFQDNQSSLKLFSHFRGFKTRDGIQIDMQRAGDKLVIRLSVSSYPAQILLEEESYFSSNNELDLTIEVQNGTNYGFRVRVWENFINTKGPFKIQQDILTEQNLIVDSFSKGLIFYNQGQGLKWGLELFRTHLIEGARVSPRFL